MSSDARKGRRGGVRASKPVRTGPAKGGGGHGRTDREAGRSVSVSGTEGLVEDGEEPTEGVLEDDPETCVERGRVGCQRGRSWSRVDRPTANP